MSVRVTHDLLEVVLVRERSIVYPDDAVPAARYCNIVAAAHGTDTRQRALDFSTDGLHVGHVPLPQAILSRNN